MASSAGFGVDSLLPLMALQLFDFLVEQFNELLANLIPFILHIFLAVLAFVLYANAHSIYLRIARPRDVPDIDSPTPLSNHKVLVVVPTFNEGKTIQDKLQNLTEIDYESGDFQIVVVDGASTDDTLDKARTFIESIDDRGPRISVIHQSERTGKSDGVLQALKTIDFGEIVLVTDANCWTETSALREAVSAFDSPEVGGVTACLTVFGQGTSWVERGEKMYWRLLRQQRIRESAKGFFFHFSGEFQMIRRGIACAAFENARYTYAEDMIGGMYVVLCGYRMQYAHKAKVVETGITTVRDLFRQKRNRAIGLIDALQFFRRSDSLNKKQYRNVVYLKTVVPLTTPLVMLGIACILYLLVPRSTFLLGFLVVMLLTTLSTTIRFLMLVQFAVLAALASHVSGRRGRFWTKTESNRFWPSIDEPT